MKNLFFLPMLFLCSISFSQNFAIGKSNEKVLIDNEKVKVVQHESQPEGDVCGLGMHYHEPHLTILLTNAKVKITPENGESQEIEVESGTSIWFDSAETHSVSNIGDRLTKMILVYLKE